MTTEAAAEDFEEQFEVVGVAGAVDDGEGAAAEGGCDLAAVIAVGAGALWLQLGIVSAESRWIAEEAGMDYVEDLCTAVVHRYEIRDGHS